jgi:tetratricopeptide (TPR) repeat protein
VSSWSNRFVSVGWLALLAACHSAPPKPASTPVETRAPAAAAALPKPAPATAPSTAVPGPAVPAAAAAAGAAAAGAAAASGGAAGNTATADAAPIPERAAQAYAQALQLMKSGRNTDAELEFKELIVAYPQFPGPQVNLGLLYLHDSRLAEAEAAFKAALAQKPNDAVAGNELGIVLRRLGKFTEAEAAYQRTIAAEPTYAPAHLNLGVLYDLYLAQPQKALEEFERYIEIAGENKQVAGWVVELRKRVGASAPAPKKEPV